MKAGHGGTSVQRNDVEFAHEDISMDARPLGAWMIIIRVENKRLALARGERRWGEGFEERGKRCFILFYY